MREAIGDSFPLTCSASKLPEHGVGCTEGGGGSKTPCLEKGCVCVTRATDGYIYTRVGFGSDGGGGGGGGAYLLRAPLNSPQSLPFSHLREY